MKVAVCFEKHYNWIKRVSSKICVTGVYSLQWLILPNCLARAVVKAPRVHSHHSPPLLFSNLYIGSKSINVSSIRFFILHIKLLLLLSSTWLSPKFDICWLALYWNLFFIFCYPLLTILIFLFKNHWSLISLCISCLIPSTIFSHSSQLVLSVPSSPLSLSITPIFFHWKLSVPVP